MNLKKEKTYLFHALFKPAVSLLKNAQTVAAITKGKKKEHFKGDKKATKQPHADQGITFPWIKT